MISQTTLNLIRSLLDEGLGNAEITKRVRKFGKATPVEVKKAIDTIIDEEAVQSESEDQGSAFDLNDNNSDATSHVEDDDSDDSDYVEDEDEDEDEDAYADDEDEDIEMSDASSSSSESTCDYDDTIPANETKKNARIYLTRRPEAGETEPDFDLIQATPLGQGLFQITYYYDVHKNCISKCKVKNRFVCNIPEMIGYVLQVLKLVSIDKQPFRDAEIMLPFYPTVSLTPSSLKKTSKRKLIANLMAIYALQADRDISNTD
jgi:hypothetical protein